MLYLGCVGHIFLYGGVSQSLLSAGIAFNVASAGQSRLRAKIKSVGPTSNPHRLIYIPKKLNETSRQRSFILPLNPFHHRIAQMREKCTASQNHFHLNQHYVKHRILPCRDVFSSFHSRVKGSSFINKSYFVELNSLKSWSQNSNEGECMLKALDLNA